MGRYICKLRTSIFGAEGLFSLISIPGGGSATMMYSVFFVPFVSLGWPMTFLIRMTGLDLSFSKYIQCHRFLTLVLCLPCFPGGCVC